MMLCSKWKWAVLGGGRHCIIVVTTFLQHHRSNNGNGCIDTPSLMRIEATIWATICHSKALDAGCLGEITTIFTTLEWPMMLCCKGPFFYCHKECHFTCHCHFTLQNYTEMTVSHDMTLFVTVEKWTLSRSGRSGYCFLQLRDDQIFAEKSIKIHLCEFKNYFPAPIVF